MSNSKFPFAVRVFCGFLISGTAFASSQLLDNGNYTTDTHTGLDWLDLTETRGLSFDDVNSQMGIGQKYDGWRFASRADVTQFWADAGGQGPFTGTASGANNWVGELQYLWGKTYPFVYTVNGYLVQGTVAMTSDASITCPTCNLTVYLLDNINDNNSSVGDIAEALQLNEAYRSQGQVPIGHALIRQTSPIPEPASLPLYALGLIAVTTFIQRARRLPAKTAA